MRLMHRSDGTSRRYPKELLVWQGPRKPYPEGRLARYRRLAEENAGTPEGLTYATLVLAEETKDARPRVYGAW